MQDEYVRTADGQPIGWAAQMDNGAWAARVMEDGAWEDVAQVPTLALALHYIKAALALQGR